MQWKGPVDDLGPGQSRKVTTTRDKQSPPTIRSTRTDEVTRGGIFLAPRTASFLVLTPGTTTTTMHRIASTTLAILPVRRYPARDIYQPTQSLL